MNDMSYPTRGEPVTKHPQNRVTGLCYLASVNLVEYYKMLPVFTGESFQDHPEGSQISKKRKAYIKAIVQSLDNNIENDFYPVKLGVEDVAKRYRYIGIGTSNFATLLAERGMSFGSQETLELTAYIYDALSQDIIEASSSLAEDRGKADGFEETYWGETLPYWLAHDSAKNLVKYRPDENRLKDLSERVKSTGLRNCLLMAIAPTATSALPQNLSESVDPVTKVFTRQEGTLQVNRCVNYDMETLSHYEKAFDIPNIALLKLAAVRQMFLDQAQSINLYYNKGDYDVGSMFQELEFAHEHGIKTLYYAKFLKEDEEDVCEGCT